MRPLSLEMKNIGPFVKKTRIDLSGIDKDGLFLISGPTGSGKSFIFDTICYSLFGRTPSGREGHLRSDHAGIGDRPRIEFTFELQGKRYMVERTLEYTDHSKRGGGTTMRNEKASLVEIVDDPLSNKGFSQKAVASKKSDVNKACSSILGLDMDQFSRVMMIPQGEFRELLRSETKDREKLLRKLFDSRLYFNVADELSAKYGKLADELKDERSRNETRIETIVTKLELDSGPGEEGKFEEWSRDTMKELDSRRRDIGEMEKNASDRWKKAAGALEMAREAFRLLKNIERDRSSIEIMERKRRPEIESLKKCLETSSKIGHLRDKLGIMDDLLLDIEGKITKKSSLEVEIIEVRERLEILKSDFERQSPDKDQELQKAHDRMVQLEGSSEKISELERFSREMDSLDGKSREMMDQIENISRVRLEKEYELQSMENEIKDIPGTEGLIELSRSREAGADLLDIMRRENEVKKEIQKNQVETSEIRVKGIDKELEALRSEREGSIAGELAKELVEGDPCPVCGSREHPDPGRASGKEITPDMIRSVETELNDARKEQNEKKEKFTSLSTELKGFQKRSKEIRSRFKDLEGLSIEELGSKLKELTKDEDLLSSSLKRREELGSRIDEIRKEISKTLDMERELIDQKNDIRLKLEGIRFRFNERSSLITDLGLDLEDPTGSLEIEMKRARDEEIAIRKWLDDRDQEIKARRDEMIRKEQDLKNLEDDLVDLEKRSTSIRKELSRTIEKIEGIASIEELKERILSQDEENDARMKVESFREELFNLRGKVEENQKRLKEIDIQAPHEIELGSMEKEVLDLRTSWEGLHGELSNLEDDIKWVSSQIELIRTSKDKMGNREKEISIIGKLTSQVKGNSIPRISLERFFLAQRFEEVLIASNHRLKILSEGRFLLRRSGSRGSRSKGGLDIDVYDNHTGQERPANTLSGGQMFLASLALALGLADVVQSRSGGIRMDALFIDEGFGSLDEETLQTALKVLSELRQGRMVGVISHVGELKRQIKTGFEVIPSTSGSSIKSIHT